jgi:hypothetical protein
MRGDIEGYKRTFAERVVVARRWASTPQKRISWDPEDVSPALPASGVVDGVNDDLPFEHSLMEDSSTDSRRIWQRRRRTPSIESRGVSECIESRGESDGGREAGILSDANQVNSTASAVTSSRSEAKCRERDGSHSECMAQPVMMPQPVGSLGELSTLSVMAESKVGEEVK